MPHYTLTTGFQLHYLTAGDHHPPGTPTVVFLHGLGSAAADWELQLGPFSQHYRVLAIDAPGHGQSSKPQQRYTAHGMADQLAELIRAIATPPRAIIGLSMGGVLAQQLAIAHPDLVQALVLVNTFAHLHSPNTLARLRALRRASRLWTHGMTGVGDMIASSLFPHPEQKTLRDRAAQQISSNPRPVYWQMMLMLARVDLRPHLADIRAPTLVVIGERDSTVPRAACEALAQHILGAQRVILPDSGHASPIDQPDAFNRAVLGFLAQQFPSPLTEVDHAHPRH